MTIGEFLKICCENEFAVQDRNRDIGCITRDGLGKYFLDYKIQCFWLDTNKYKICILLADE